MDMNLTPMEAGSWWREDGYETLDEGEGSEDKDGDEETNSSEDEEDDSSGMEKAMAVIDRY